jgi:uncharacterized membrane protein YjfL (UPF0719 family)
MTFILMFAVFGIVYGSLLLHESFELIRESNVKLYID